MKSVLSKFIDRKITALSLNAHGIDFNSEDDNIIRFSDLSNVWRFVFEDRIVFSAHDCSAIKDADDTEHPIYDSIQKGEQDSNAPGADKGGKLIMCRQIIEGAAITGITVSPSGDWKISFSSGATFDCFAFQEFTESCIIISNSKNKGSNRIPLSAVTVLDLPEKSGGKKPESDREKATIRQDLEERWRDFYDELTEGQFAPQKFKTLFSETWRYFIGATDGKIIKCNDLQLYAAVSRLTGYNDYPLNIHRWEYDAAIKFVEGLLLSVALENSGDRSFSQGYVYVDVYHGCTDYVHIDSFEQKFVQLCDTYAEDYGFDDEPDVE